MNFEELKKESLKNNIVLTDEMIEKYDRYADLLKEWNEKINGVFISMKGSQGEEETALAKHALAELGSSAPIVEKEDLPDGAKRVFVICKKAKKTPMKYPRAYAKIKKKPL